MAATVIDALLVTLGLDTSDFRKGQKDVSDDLKKQREDAKKPPRKWRSREKGSSILRQHKDGAAGTDWRYRHCRRPDEPC